MKKRKIGRTLLSSTLAAAVAVAALPGALLLSPETVKAYSMGTPYTEELSNVTVHDPSIVKDPVYGSYYAFGSHFLEAVSDDLVLWENAKGTGYKTTNNIFFGDLNANLAEPFKWAGKDDGDCKGGYSIWAPDVIYNPNYVKEDGSTGAWMMYFCTTSSAVRSVIAYGVADEVDGTYQYKGCLVYSGFSQEEAYDSASNKSSTEPTSYSEIDKCYTNTNIDELIADGTLKDGFDSANWIKSGDRFNNSYGPNAIDPNVFFDKDGRMWMSYGSWSGGIYILEIDPATGKAIYPGKSSTSADGLTVDQYFGTRIAGGYAKSGEGPYIVYDEETEYYYLYTTYNWLGPEGGYCMRLSRSKNPDGPYYDAAGNNAAFQAGTNANTIGIKVMGNYNMPGDRAEKWDGYRSPGHNSVLIDDDGQRYLVYHTRYGNNGDIHNMRIHQQFMNEKGWPVTAVYENRGDQISGSYARSEIVGKYAFINHGINNDGKGIKSANTIEMKADGSITGVVSGKWTRKYNEDKTYYFATIQIDDTVYHGVFFKQHQSVDTDPAEVMTFTAIGSNNCTIWGVRTGDASDQAKADTTEDITIVDPADNPKPVVVEKKASTIQLSNKTVTYNGKAQAIGTAVTSGSAGKVAYTYYSDKACTKTVAASAVKNAGTYYVKATVAEDANYKGATSNVASLTITKAANTLKLTVKSKKYSVKKNLKKKKTFNIGAKKAVGKVSYKLDSKAKKAKIKVTSKGKVTVPKKCKKGTYKITVKAAGNANYKTKSITVTIKVNK